MDCCYLGKYWRDVVLVHHQKHVFCGDVRRYRGKEEQGEVMKSIIKPHQSRESAYIFRPFPPFLVSANVGGGMLDGRCRLLGQQDWHHDLGRSTRTSMKSLQVVSNLRCFKAMEKSMATCKIICGEPFCITEPEPAYRRGAVANATPRPKTPSGLSNGTSAAIQL